MYKLVTPKTFADLKPIKSSILKRFLKIQFILKS